MRVRACSAWSLGLMLCVGGGGVLCARSVHAQADSAWRAMNQPVAPFRIIGNIFYVGASDVTSFLVVTPEGDILIDGGFAETAPQIEANIEQLGFHLRDVKILLNSHAHGDHAGGLSELQRATGAALYASAGDAPVLERGGQGDRSLVTPILFPRIAPTRLLHDGDTVVLGGTTLTAHITAGHTKGCTTWTTVATEHGVQHPVVFVCSTSVLPGIPLVGNPAYPEIATDYAQSFRVLRALRCDVFLGAHGSFFNLAEKRQALRDGAKGNPFIDPAGYRAYVEAGEAAYLEELHREQGSDQGHPGPPPSS